MEINEMKRKMKLQLQYNSADYSHASKTFDELEEVLK
jgi:hypothetical protein